MVGCAAGAGLVAAKPWIASLFAPSHATRSVLTGPAWSVLAAAQPVNAVAFVTDGLLYGLHLFGGGARVMAAGFTAVYVPCLVAAAMRSQGIWGVWAAKLALNVARGAGGLACVASAWRQTTRGP